MTEISFTPGVDLAPFPGTVDHSEMIQLDQPFARRAMDEHDPMAATATKLYADKLFGPEDGFASLDDALLGVAELTSGWETAIAVFEYDDRFYGGRLQWQLDDSLGNKLSHRQHIDMEGADPVELEEFFGGTTPADNFKVYQRALDDPRPVPLRAIVDGKLEVMFDLPELDDFLPNGAAAGADPAPAPTPVPPAEVDEPVAPSPEAEPQDPVEAAAPAPAGG